MRGDGADSQKSASIKVSKFAITSTDTVQRDLWLSDILKVLRNNTGRWNCNMVVSVDARISNLWKTRCQKATKLPIIKLPMFAVFGSPNY